MKKKIELPLVEPLYSTYHNQATGSAIIFNNQSIKNWYYNQVLILTCNRKFLNGYTTPEINVDNSLLYNNPYLERKNYDMRFLKGYTNYVIKNLLNEGYYIHFKGIDDYYIEGKSWYRKRHFIHDGCICGYDQENKKYCIYAYDQNWICRKFWVSKKSFNAGMRSAFKQGKYDSIIGLKPKTERVEFSLHIALKNIEEYLDSSFEKYPESEEGTAYGIVVHDYIAKYIDKLYDGSIPYEKMDRRVLRVIWDHKKVMHTRIELIEKELSLGSDISSAYLSIVKEADNARMLYASHNMKRRDAILPIVKKKLIYIKEREHELLTNLLEKCKGEKNK